MNKHAQPHRRQVRSERERISLSSGRLFLPVNFAQDEVMNSEQAKYSRRATSRPEL